MILIEKILIRLLIQILLKKTQIIFITISIQESSRAGEKENLSFGTGLQSDTNLVKLIDLADIDGSQNVRFVMRYTAAVGYAYGAEIVYYTV